jgi:hypothetical protein
MLTTSQCSLIQSPFSKALYIVFIPKIMYVQLFGAGYIMVKCLLKFLNLTHSYATQMTFVVNTNAPALKGLSHEYFNVVF